MGKVKLSNIKAYGHHGCLQEEAIIGSDYRVDLEVVADLTKASQSDNLLDTVDYVHLNRIVKEEMKIRAKLLEHVAKRIVDRVFSELAMVEEIKISVSKINPPIGGDVEMVSINLQRIR
ncbi:dihydroneopterin aldolase [Sediminicola arcticus]|uniref:7,8-dihydroneopterin aldolase n=1 Tax=Sediminicola arcticus TaxID=1574308 RepID=A0ABV2SQT8_9FLAO